MQSPPIGFLHVPKTGGTTLGTVLEDLFIPQLGVRSYNFHMNPDWRKSPDPFAYEEAFFKDANYDMYRGHIHYHPHPKIRWISMVRHPVSHFISWFYSWFKLMRVHESYPQEIRDLYDCTLEEYLDEFKEAWSQEPWPQTHYDFTWSKRPLSQLNYFSRSNNIQEALERVRSEAIVTGLFERYQESMALYNAALNLPLPVDPVKKNIGSYAPPSTEIKARIASLIPLEMDFYQGVKEIFQDSLERYGIDQEKIEALGRRHRVRHDPPIVFLERKTHNRRLSHYQTLNCIGAGEVFRAFIKNRENDCPIKLLDWNEGTWGQTIEGHTVLSPDHLANDHQDMALLTPPVSGQAMSQLAQNFKGDVAVLDESASFLTAQQKQAQRDMLATWYLEVVRKQTARKKLILWGASFRAQLLSAQIIENKQFEITHVIDNHLETFNGLPVTAFEDISLDPKAQALVLCMNPSHYFDVEAQVRSVSNQLEIIRLHYTR